MSTATRGDSEVTRGVDRMYAIYERLNSAEDKTLLENDFKDLLSAVKRSEKERRLASQFITRFIEHFPFLYDDALNAMLDLCEDDDVSIRRQVAKDLVIVCRNVQTFIPKIADVFAQLMQTDDTGELKALEGCLSSLFTLDSRAALVGLFVQIAGGQALVQERALKFLAGKIKDLSFPSDTVKSQFENTLFSEAKRSALNMNGEQFKVLHSILLSLEMMKSVSGQQMMVDMISEMLDMEKKFDASEVENFERLFTCTKHSLQSFSNQISSNSYLMYYCTNVLPNLGESEIVENGSNYKLEALRFMADVAVSANHLDAIQARLCLNELYSQLLTFLPLPPPEEVAVVNPDFELGFIEPILFTFHKVGSFCPEFLTEDEERLSEFRKRLQFLGRAAQAYTKVLRGDLQEKIGQDELRNEENKKKMTTNIAAVVKDLFHTPPIYKAKVGLSWRPITRQAIPGQTSKRPAQTSGGGSAQKYSRNGNRELYQPPSGKFSGRGGAFAPSNRPARGGSAPYRPRGGGGVPFRGGRQRGRGRGRY